MKNHLKIGLLFLALAALPPSPSLRADDPSTDTTTGTDAPAKGRGNMLSFLSREDKMKFIKARQQVLANNADLKAEQDQLDEKRGDLKSGDADDKKQFVQTWMAHQKKMKAAMLQEDPTLGPVLDEIDAKMKEKFQQRGA